MPNYFIERSATRSTCRYVTILITHPVMLVPDVFRALPESPEKLRLRGPLRLKTVAEVWQWTRHFLCEQLITVAAWARTSNLPHARRTV